MPPPFCLFADATVQYIGRAISTLARGRYLIVYKVDGSLLVHGASKVQARNYQRAGTLLTAKGNTIHCKNGDESITIDLHDVLWLEIMDDWSLAETQITRTEKELADHIFGHIDDYVDNVVFAHREYPTGLGPVDVLAITADGVHHVIEAKRGRISLSACTQVRRYLEAMADQPTRGYVAGPDISATARRYCEKHQLTWLEVSHAQDAVPDIRLRPETNIHNRDRRDTHITDLHRCDSSLPISPDSPETNRAANRLILLLGDNASSGPAQAPDDH